MCKYALVAPITVEDVKFLKILCFGYNYFSILIKFFTIKIYKEVHIIYYCRVKGGGYVIGIRIWPICNVVF